MPRDPLIAEYLDAIRYRRYSQSVLMERRRFLELAVAGGPDAWFMAAPVEEVVAGARARSRVRSKANLQKLRSAVEDYRRWRRRRRAGDGAERPKSPARRRVVNGDVGDRPFRPALEALELLLEPGGVAELRAIGRDGRIASGYFDDPATLADGGRSPRRRGASSRGSTSRSTP